MLTSDPSNTPQPHRGMEVLENDVSNLELHLTQLRHALQARDSAAIDLHASQLHRALAQTVEHFAQAAHGPQGLPTALRQRLSNASGEVAAQRESLARATAALDRAMDVLLPPQTPSLYSTQGATERTSQGGSLQA